MTALIDIILGRRLRPRHGRWPPRWGRRRWPRGRRIVAEANQDTSRHPTLSVTADVYAEIRRSVGAMPAEQGGVLGGSRRDGVVRHFYFDTSARRTGATYSPDHVTVNRLFQEQWNPAGINLLGFVHSHPGGFGDPSGGDLVYARSILAAIPELERLLLPIVLTEHDAGRFRLLPFGVVRHGRDVRVEPMLLRIEEVSARVRPNVYRPPRPITSRDDRIEHWSRLALLGALGSGHPAALYALVRTREEMNPRWP